MKKVVLFNTIVSVFYFFLEFSFPMLLRWAEQIPSGTETVLGMLIPIVGPMIAVLCVGSVIYSIINSILQRKVVRLLPILILLISGFFYVLIFDQNSFWRSVIDYYMHL